MRVVLQRVNHAQVAIEGEVVGKIGRGYMLLVGFAPTDGDDQLDYLVHKIVNLRVFEDEDGKKLMSCMCSVYCVSKQSKISSPVIYQWTLLSF